MRSRPRWLSVPGRLTWLVVTFPTPDASQKPTTRRTSQAPTTHQRCRAMRRAWRSSTMDLLHRSGRLTGGSLPNNLLRVKQVPIDAHTPRIRARRDAARTRAAILDAAEEL